MTFVCKFSPVWAFHKGGDEKEKKENDTPCEPDHVLSSSQALYFMKSLLTKTLLSSAWLHPSLLLQFSLDDKYISGAAPALHSVARK